MLHPKIIREYDIRGEVPEDLSPCDAYKIGWAFAQLLLSQSHKTPSASPSLVVAMGRDGRVSSPALAQALGQGLVDGGADTVFDLGLVPSPLAYFSLQQDAKLPTEPHAAVIVTGSHNPAHYNGFKFALKSRPFFGADIQELAKLATAAPTKEDGALNPYKPVPYDLNNQYLCRLLQEVQPEPVWSALNSLRIAWDPGNGATVTVLKEIIARLPGQHFIINNEIDGTFPGRPSDPTVASHLADLATLVKHQQCHVGIAFDGDGDRIGVIDATGSMISGDQLTLFFAQDLLKTHPGAMVINDIKSSQVVINAMQQLGAQVLMWRTGHSLIKAKMLEVNALLAGELSGHIFCKDRYYGFDDGLYAAMRLLRIMTEHSSLNILQEFRQSLPSTYVSPELHFPCDYANKFATIERIKAELRAKHQNFIDIDGVRVTTAAGWWLIRASNTQDMLSARCEASSLAELDQLQQTINQYIRRFII